MSSLFIGLGGVGTGTLECLSKKMDDYNESLSARGLKETEAYYYYIDTDESIYNEDPSRFENGTQMFFKHIGLNSPDSIIAGYDRVNIIDYKKWYDAPSKKTNMILGADAVRQYSRLALRSVYQDVYNELEPIIRNVVSEQSRGRIYVVTGSCGGTGCGIYMDILYMINEIYETTKTKQWQTDVRLIMAMPQGYIPNTDERLDIQKRKTLLNSYGTLTELNAVCKDTYTVDDNGNRNSAFSFCSVNKPEDKGLHWAFGPFRFGYLYESSGQSREEVSQKMSDFIFEIELAGKDVENIAEGKYSGSKFDILLTNKIEGEWDSTASAPFVKAFCSMGQFSIEKPDEMMRRYLKERLLFEAFHKGLIDSGIYLTDTALIAIEGNRLQQQIEDAKARIREEIERSVTQEALKNETLCDTVYKCFSQSPDVRNELTKVVLDQKAILLDQVRRMTYAQCTEWLKEYDFTTVFKILDYLDVNLYAEAQKAHENIGDRMDAAKADSKGGILNRWKPEKAVEKFIDVLGYWLTYEVNKALTASEKDITIDNKGYLDSCKQFISNAKQLLSLPKKNEEWESNFKKDLNELKLKNDRCYIPELGTIMDDTNNILLDSPMVVNYETQLVVPDNKADLNEGTCSLNMLHKEIFKQMSTNKLLIQSGVELDKLFDPAPGANNSLRRTDKVTRFIEEYVQTANGIIDDLIQRNQAITDLFKTDIITRLASMGKKERARICLKFKQYDKVELKTIDLPADAGSIFKVCISNFAGKTDIEQELDIVDVNGRPKTNSAIIDDDFYSDKIVKLIVKCGYSIDEYRYFEDYLKYASEKMTKDQPHNPFIDMRFKGTIKRNVYEMNVYQTMRDIAEATRKEALNSNVEMDEQDRYQEYSLSGCAESEIYAVAVSVLYNYFAFLKNNKKIRKEFENGIMINGTEVSFKRYKYKPASERYVEEPEIDVVDLKKQYGINDFIGLGMWIEEVMSHKEDIVGENDLVKKALDFFYDNHITLSDEIEEKISEMKGTGMKPKYDFLRAYQNWLKSLK